MNSKWILPIVILSLTLSHCSSKSKKKEEVKSISTPVSTSIPENIKPPELQNEKTQQSSPSKELDDLKVTLKKAEATVINTNKVVEPVVIKNTPTTSSAHQSHHASSDKSDSVPAEKALGWLKNGNTRFMKGYFRKDGASKKDIERLSSGQKPHSIILSCSDSRVPPEVLFDQKLGEIFVVRTAGQSLDSASLASIEYAVEHLGSQLLVVMGHSSCGAVKAAFGAAPGTDIGSPHLNALVADIQPRIASKMKAKPSESYVAEGWDNTMGAVTELMEKSKIVREAVKNNHLRIESALYHLNSGAVEWSH
ncbi:MAG: hypothetical protein HUU56_06440 [Bdellovibrionaceae bacterium]|nr:hypothetical protein [Pseudobdellovibrionaceae bacterium]